MSFRPRIAPWIVTLAAIVGSHFCDCPTCAWSAEPLRVRTGFDRATSPLVRTDLRVESAASCAATACHGGGRAGIANAGAARGSEYPLWLERDPHAMSWRTFCSKSSVQIMERLRIMQSGQIIDPAGFDNCLACHNSTRQFAEARPAEHFLREGVGCSSCHGPSENWRSTHFLTGWTGFTAGDEGFVPAKNMLVRARMCAACHVGDSDRDMNHDIIAAGHPALYYEFATFHGRQPKHWRDKAERDTTRFEASLWLAGQLAALDASLVLLEARADRALPISRWPEFAAYNCSACHQQLRIGDADRPPAQLSTTTVEFSHWNRFGVEELLRLRRAEGKSSPHDARLADALEALTRSMQMQGSSAAESKRAARATRLALDAWLHSAEGQAEVEQFTAQRLRSLAISAGREEANHENWETASQFHLASVAARQAWANSTGATTALRGRSSSGPSGIASNVQVLTARQLRNALSFRSGTSSPQPEFRLPLREAWRNHLRAIESAVASAASSDTQAPPLTEGFELPLPKSNY